MTLRLRLTLIYTLLVTLTLAVSGVGLHLLLARGLGRSLDESLQQAASLLSGFMEQEDGAPKLQPEGEIVPQLSADLVAVLVTADGQVLDSLGRVPSPLPRIQTGLSTQSGWRVWSESVQGVTLLTLRDTRSIAESVRRFDFSFLILAPLAVLLAFGLGYLFSGQALRLVRHLTDAALDLATRRAWQERLPEPVNQDELWRLSQATNTLLAALADVIESERRFTADAAHELRTPLTVLRGRLEQAAEKTKGSKVQPSLTAALTASDDLLALVEKLLLLARTEAGQGLHHQQVALDEVVFDVAGMLKPLFAKKGLRLDLDLPVDDVRVEGDRVALGLLARNILDNALKFTPTGQVSVRVEMQEARAYLRVRDSGPGISELALPHLFERFFQADVRHRQSGSGLGLALAQSIAHWHGGSLRVVNRREGGAEFTLELPAVISSRAIPGREFKPERLSRV